ncbi:DUF3325 domain-containing protein [Marivibrio halodurans]|uniref:DUF3325 domain-containing protein n=1 Tax=Marivibrio halodurans TaxID=2039722 RepID=A0A8J7RWQ1_9PROT|nr:DUF3325 domain-containing protein [Marivibrio halodurans]MBP5855905.1 DUF3325 domain-containing protein [Marivibrio halodurans]
MLIAAVFCAVYAGWAALALAMDRHARDIGRTPPRPATVIVLRLAGTGVLAAALAGCAARWGWAIGPVAWLGMLGVGALLFTLTLSVIPRAAVPAAAALAMVGTISAGASLLG